MDEQPQPESIKERMARMREELAKRRIGGESPDTVKDKQAKEKREREEARRARERQEEQLALARQLEEQRSSASTMEMELDENGIPKPPPLPPMGLDKPPKKPLGGWGKVEVASVEASSKGVKAKKLKDRPEGEKALVNELQEKLKKKFGDINM